MLVAQPPLPLSAVPQPWALSVRILSADGPSLLPCGLPAPSRAQRARVNAVRACKLDSDAWTRGSKEAKKARQHQVRKAHGQLATGSWEQRALKVVAKGMMREEML